MLFSFTCLLCFVYSIVIWSYQFYFILPFPYARENWRKLKSFSSQLYKKRKKALGKGNHMLHLHATI